MKCQEKVENLRSIHVFETKIGRWMEVKAILRIAYSVSLAAIKTYLRLRMHVGSNGRADGCEFNLNCIIAVTTCYHGYTVPIQICTLWTSDVVKIDQDSPSAKKDRKP